MKLSIVIPVYNEKDTVEEILKRVEKVAVEKEIIVVDDGSTDGTSGILKNLQEPQVKVLFHKNNMGKGRALRTGFKKATGDYIIVQDADLEYDPQDFLKLLKVVENKGAKVVFGSRFKNPVKARLSYKTILARSVLTFLANLLYDAEITDEATAYKMFKRDILKEIDLKCNGFEFCPEFIAKVKKKGYKIYEVPISYRPRKLDSKKKVGWRDGLEAVYTLLRLKILN